MADDVILPGDGSTVATDEIGGKHYQRIKIELGAEGAAGTLLTVGQKTMANSISVCLASDQSALSANISQWGGVATSLGQKSSANSVPVVIANDQTQVNVAIEGAPLLQQDTLTTLDFGVPVLGYDLAATQYATLPLGNSGTTLQVENDSPSLQSTDFLTFNGDAAQIVVGTYKSLLFSISGTYASVTVAFQGSIDNGVSFLSQRVSRVDSNYAETTAGPLTNTTRGWKVSIDGLTHFKVLCTGYLSGTATIKFSASKSPHDPVPTVTDIALAGGYTTAYIDGTTVLQQDTLTSFYNVMPAGGWDASMGAFAALPLTNNGSTVPVEVTGTVAVSSGTSTLANVARGKIAAASLTNAYANLLTMGGQGRVLHIYNSTDQPALFSLDAGSTDSIELDAGESYVIDYVANALIATSSTIQAKYVSVAPSVGSVRAILARS